MLDKIILDVVQDFAEPVKRFNVIDLAGAQQGVHHSSAPGLVFKPEKKILFIFLLYRLHEIPDQTVA